MTTAVVRGGLWEQPSCARPGGSRLPAEYEEVRWRQPASAVRESLWAMLGHTRPTQRPFDVQVCTCGRSLCIVVEETGARRWT